MRLIWPTELMTPLHVHGVRTREEYLAEQRRFIANGRAARPALDWQEPYRSKEQPDAYVTGGKLAVRCACGNSPSLDREWRLACCFECGAIYEDVVLPDNLAMIEAVLVKRHPSVRGWESTETVADLERENARLDERAAARDIAMLVAKAATVPAKDAG